MYISHIIASRQLSIPLLTKTWLCPEDTLHLVPHLSLQFDMLSAPRNALNPSGGLAAMYSSSLFNATISPPTKKPHSFEVVFLSFFSKNIYSHPHIEAIIIYNLNNYSCQVSFEEFELLFFNFKPTHAHRPIILGYFNFWPDSLSNHPSSLAFLKLLNNLSLFSINSKPTHTNGHTLNLVLSFQALLPSDPLSMDYHWPHFSLISGHSLITINIVMVLNSFPPPSKSPYPIPYRCKFSKLSKDCLTFYLFSMLLLPKFYFLPQTLFFQT